MKTAVIVAGVCRFTELTYRSWSVLPEADWYLSTWDITQQPYSPVATLSQKEIANIKHLFRKILISNYQQEYLDTRFNSYHRPFILLEKVLELIKHQDYERIIYFRPDLMLYTLEFFSQEDFAVDDNTIKILDCHGPDFWIHYLTKTMQDSFLVFSWNRFQLFVNSRLEICQGDIHTQLYDFMEKHQIEVIPLCNMRSVILRENSYEYKNDLSWENLTTAFMDTFFKNNRIGKFTNTIELKIHRSPDLEKIRISQSQGGILKLRNRRR